MDGASVGGAPVLNTWKGGFPKISLQAEMSAGRTQEMVQKGPNVLILNSISEFHCLFFCLLTTPSSPHSYALLSSLLSTCFLSIHLFLPLAGLSWWYWEDGCDSGKQLTVMRTGSVYTGAHTHQRRGGAEREMAEQMQRRGEDGFMRERGRSRQKTTW